MPETAPTDPNPAREAFETARRLAESGRYAEALERHEWFHEHALEHDSAFYGVRLSFALGAWFRLGEKYRPALESLRSIRDRSTELVRLPGSSDELFHDVVAINRVLGQNSKTMELFREIESAWPDLAKRRFRFMVEEAFESDGELFLRYTPDLVGYARQLHDFYQNMITRTSSQIQSHLGPGDGTAQAQKRITDKYSQNLKAAIHRLAALAGSSGRSAEAAEIMKPTPDPTNEAKGLSA